MIHFTYMNMNACTLQAKTGASFKPFREADKILLSSKCLNRSAINKLPSSQTFVKKWL